ncbi:VOC family protein [Spirillospora sp. CA-108201]
MTDPLEALRAPVVPIDPDPDFAARLRERLQRALLQPTGDTMTTDTIHDKRHGDIGYASVWVPDVERAVAFYGAVLGWHADSGATGAVRHIEGLPEQHIGLSGGQEQRTVYLAFAVEDVHEAVRQVRDAGGDAQDPTDEPYGLSAMCTDDQGLRFSVYQPPEVVSQVEARLAEAAGLTARHGEISYLTIGVPDIARARSFYGEVLNWEFRPGHTPGGWSVHLHGTEVRPMTGMYGGADRPVVVPMYTVDDIGAAVTRVREAGGTATAPARQPYGVTAECTDDQGSRFYLGQH